jgi:hypothetical protein
MLACQHRQRRWRTVARHIARECLVIVCGQAAGGGARARAGAAGGAAGGTAAQAHGREAATQAVKQKHAA